jgi:hypothetical protein
MKSKLLIFFLQMFLIFSVSAQAAEPEMADAFRSNGKIFVVLACVLMVLAGIAIFLLILEKRISRLEKEARP